jgi:dolichol-phosphate mannosyltransferase
MVAMARWSKDKAVSIIIRAWNKRGNITPFVQKLHDSLADYNYEIVFIHDNSSDGTADLVSTLSQKYAVKAVVRKNKKGLASTVVDWLRQVNCETVVVMDADLQHPPEVVPNILQALESYDLAVASRYCKTAAPETGDWRKDLYLTLLTSWHYHWRQK